MAGFEIAGRVVGAEGQGVVVVQVKAWPLGSVPADSSARLLAHDVGALLGHGAAGLVANSAGSLVATERNTTSLVGLTDGKGQFRLRLPEGRYNLEAVRSSAQKGWLHDVVVGGPEAASADLTLKITPTASLRGRMLVGTMPGQVPDLTKVEVLVA
ncbi:MAG: hypothetical protein VKO21_08480 [Candidatus Sericytochromatia bacterium]|nr:hypothetical protein [Candidatus Sericytochromatia bacterium]